jgi:hypothetical protein
MGIMNDDDYFNTVYHLTGATGRDAELWSDTKKVVDSATYTLNGYYLRVKKINDTIIPINQTLIDLNKDLLEKKAKLSVEEATYEASVNGIEQVREDF